MGYFDDFNGNDDMSDDMISDESLNGASTFDDIGQIEQMQEDNQVERVDFDDYQQDNDKQGTDYKSIAKYAIIIGVIILLIGILFIWLSNKNKSDSTPTKSKSEDTEQSSEVSKSSSSWVALDEVDNLPFSSLVKSNLTVTYVQHYALSQGDTIQLKSIVKGSISGLTGTYEVTMPYRSGRKIKIGDTINVQYALGDKNGSKIIGELTTK